MPSTTSAEPKVRPCVQHIVNTMLLANLARMIWQRMWCFHRNVNSGAGAAPPRDQPTSSTRLAAFNTASAAARVGSWPATQNPINA